VIVTGVSVVGRTPSLQARTKVERVCMSWRTVRGFAVFRTIVLQDSSSFARYYGLSRLGRQTLLDRTTGH
jgi:hypothetical protein